MSILRFLIGEMENAGNTDFQGVQNRMQIHPKLIIDRVSGKNKYFMRKVL
jgi:hypothetical protein